MPFTEVVVMKVIVKYSKEYPYLPVAVGDSRHDLARILHKSPTAISRGVQRGIVYQEIEIGEIEDEGN